jgi:hypothetical protein
MDTATTFDVWMAPVENVSDSLHAGTPVRLVGSRYYETFPSISPDGRWLAYASDESGSPEVYVRSLSDTSVKAPVVVGAGGVPRWSPKGRQLFYTTVDRRIMVADYTVVDGKLVPGNPRPWAPVRLADTGVLPNYDVGADGRYIVALLPVPVPGAQTDNHVTLIRGLPSELRRRAP